MTACAFYGLTLIILPFEPNTAPSINALLKRSSPDVVIGQGGQLPVQELEGVTLKEIIFVVEAASQHLDWSAPPGSGVKSTQYDEIVKNTVEDSPEVSIDLNAPAVIIFGPRVSGESELVEFSHRVCALCNHSLRVFSLHGINRILLPVLHLNPLCCPKQRDIARKMFLFQLTRSRIFTRVFIHTLRLLLGLQWPSTPLAESMPI
jgi:hypothetical protein